jgi:hypothetical protein
LFIGGKVRFMGITVNIIRTNAAQQFGWPMGRAHKSGFQTDRQKQNWLAGVHGTEQARRDGILGSAQIFNARFVGSRVSPPLADLIRSPFLSHAESAIEHLPGGGGIYNLSGGERELYIKVPSGYGEV